MRNTSARESFSQHNQTWKKEWNSVIFTNEKKFNLDGPDGYKYYWHQLGSNYQHYSKRAFGGKSLMVWAGFAFGGKMELQFISNRLNAKGYQSLLQSANIIDQGTLIAGENFKLMHDRAPPHAVSLIFKIKVFSYLKYLSQAQSTQKWLADNDISLLKWCAMSPDLNPMENLWAILSRRVYANGKQYNTVVDLKDSIKKEWDAINDDTLVDLINSMPDRIFQLIQTKGKAIKY